jgi:hypothetical protein
MRKKGAAKNTEMLYIIPWTNTRASQLMRNEQEKLFVML